MLTRLYRYINPIEHLGEKKYSLFFPFLTMLVTFAIIEAIVYFILKDPMAVGNFAIFIPIALIVYFAFRDGIMGGFISAALTIAYYFYIIYSRHYTGNQLQSGIDTTAILGTLFFLIALIIGWLKITIDSLIDREANEKKRLQAIIQQLPVGVMITDEKGIIVQSNKQIESILGMKVPEQFTAGKDKLFKNPTYKNKPVSLSQGPLVLALTAEKTIVGREYEIDRPDNKRGYLLVSATPIHNRKGKIIAAASILQDITEQKEMEARKDDFVNMASHELKTPITSMKLYIDSLTKYIKQYNDPKANKTLTSIKYQTERLQELVSDLLDVSRLQTGKLLFTRETFRLDVLVQETIEGLQGTTKNQEIIFSKKITNSRLRRSLPHLSSTDKSYYQCSEILS